jgi:hypothetical protein
MKQKFHQHKEYQEELQSGHKRINTREISPSIVQKILVNAQTKQCVRPPVMIIRNKSNR